MLGQELVSPPEKVAVESSQSIIWYQAQANLVGNKKFEAVLNEHRKRLVDWCAETGDEFSYIKPI